MIYFGLVAMLVFASFQPILNTRSSHEVFGEYPTINGIKCDQTEHFNFHYHAHLDIFVHGFSYLLPAGIGIKPPECIYWLHTHDSSGIIHIESPENKTFTLGQFFDVWGQKFDNYQLFDMKADNSTDRALTAYVNGTEIKGTSYRDIPLANHEEITIVFGTPPPKIPPYEFQY
jgi:hypothetical protein